MSLKVPFRKSAKVCSVLRKPCAIIDELCNGHGLQIRVRIKQVTFYSCYGHYLTLRYQWIYDRPQVSELVVCSKMI